MAIQTENAVERTEVRGEIVDLRYLFGVWLRWSWVLVVLGAIGAYIGISDLQSRPPVYVAKMTVLPDLGNNAAGGGQFGNVLGGLGIQIGGAASTNFDRMKVLVRSITLAEILQRKYGLMQERFAGSWDGASGTWKRPEGDEFERQQKIRRFFGLSQWSEPTTETLAKSVGGAVQFEKDKDGPFWEVRVSGANRENALRLLTIAYSEADELLRQQDRVESQQRRRYLETQLGGLTNVDVRQALIGLMSSEQRRAMMLESNLPYAARIIEPPYVSSLPEEPNVKLAIALPAIGIVGLGLLVITAIALFRRE